MKTPIALIVCAAAGVAVAGEFVNLNFNQPDFSRLRTTPSGARVGPVEDLLRGWEVSIRPSMGEWTPFREEIPVVFDGGGDSPIALDRGLHIDLNNFSVVFNILPAIGGLAKPEPPDVRISTKGKVPLDANFFEWDAGAGLEVTVSDGRSQVTAVGSAGLVKVSRFAGSDVTIQFVLRSGGYGRLDVVGFTKTARVFPISQPSKLRLSLSGKDSVTLTWAPPTDGVLGYAVFSAPNLETPFTNRVGGLVTEISFTFPRPQADVQFYQVRSVGASSRSGEAVIQSSVDVTPEVP